MPDPDLRTAEERLEAAKEEFLCLIADAVVWKEEIDGEYDEDGRAVTTVTYRGEFQHNSLLNLLEAFGIQVSWNETAGLALERALEQ